MASDYNAAVSCLTGAFTSFITKEASLLTERMASIVESFTDPLEALASTNVSQAVDGVTSLTEGSVAGNLASIGEAIIINKIQRELNDILADVIKSNPAIGDAIQRITNLSEAVYGIISLAVLLRKEAPYSAVHIVIEELEEMLDTKTANLNQMKQHIIQLNNVLMSTTDNPTTAALLLQQDLAEVSTELGNAAEDLLALETSMYGNPSIYVEKNLDAAETHLDTAASKLSPPTDTNLLDVGSAIAQDALGTEFLTDAQIKMSSYAVRPLTIVINCELTAIDKATKKINNALQQLPLIIPSYESAVESNAMIEFRVKLVRQLRIRVEALKDDIDAALTKNSLDSLALHALSWTSRLGAIQEEVPKVRNQMYADSEDQERLAQMNAELDAMLAALNDVNTTYTTAAIEDTTALKTQVTTLINQGKAIMRLMGTSQMTNYDVQSFRITANAVTSGGASAINDSIGAITRIKSALALYQTEPPVDQRIDQLLSLLELMGMDRAKDLLKLGQFKDFLDTTIDDASYIGLAIKCLISVEDLVTDTATLATLQSIRETLEGQRVSELAAAFDILDSGKNAAISEIKNRLEEGQNNLTKIKQVVETLKELAKKAGESVTAIEAAAAGLDEELGEIATGAGGSLNSVLSDLDIDGLQSGCLGQLRY